MKNKKKTSLFAQTFDTLFIMILCFATLLAAMLMQGEIGGIHYTIDLTKFSITMSILILYLVVIIPKSDKGLKDMINELYGYEK